MLPGVLSLCRGIEVCCPQPRSNQPVFVYESRLLFLCVQVPKRVTIMKRLFLMMILSSAHFPEILSVVTKQARTKNVSRLEKKIYPLLFLTPPPPPTIEHAVFSPLTTSPSCLHFYREKISAFLPSSTSIELCPPTLQGALNNFIF